MLESYLQRSKDMKDKPCWLCGVKITESMREEYECNKLCPECQMDAEDFGIDEDLLQDIF